jgi:hypothetical protein
MNARTIVGTVAPVVGWFVIALPPGSRLLESTMTSHMLVQLPLLVGGGWWLGGRLVMARARKSAVLRVFRWALLVTAVGTLALWMIPRLLDLAVEARTVDAGKALSLAVLAGMPLRWCWSLSGPVVRGLLQVEALASCWRLGWLYLESPDRLCRQYRFNDQLQLGQLLLVVGTVYAVWLAWNALRETPQTER